MMILLGDQHVAMLSHIVELLKWASNISRPYLPIIGLCH
jgi:hypothetical protein